MSADMNKVCVGCPESGHRRRCGAPLVDFAARRGNAQDEMRSSFWLDRGKRDGLHIRRVHSGAGLDSLHFVVQRLQDVCFVLELS